MRTVGIRHVWIALTIGAAFIGPASSPIGSPDIFWTLLAGRWMANHTALLDADPFTSAPLVDGPLPNPQWLADLAYYGFETIGGLPLVIVATAVAIALAYALTLAAARTASSSLRLSCVAVGIAYALGVTNLNPRPQTLVYPLFALVVLAVARAEWRNDTRLLWTLPPAIALWSNLHGSFFLAFLVLGCAGLGRMVATRRLLPARPFALTLLGCVLASLLNPYGPGALLYVASIGNNPIIRDRVTEWAPTTVASHEGILFFGSLLVVGGLALKARVRLSAFEVLMLVAFGCLGWSSVRAVAWWGLAIAPIVARLASSAFSWRFSAGRDQPVLNALIVAGILGLAVASLPWFKTGLPFLPADKRAILADDTPVRVGEYLREHPSSTSGLLFDEQTWGGYLEWAAWPRQQPFVDGRFELHPAQVWLDYLDIVFPSARWRVLLDQYHVGSAVLSLTEQPELIADMRTDSRWQVDYEDDQAVVLSRVASPGP